MDIHFICQLRSLGRSKKSMWRRNRIIAIQHASAGIPKLDWKWKLGYLESYMYTHFNPFYTKIEDRKGGDKIWGYTSSRECFERQILSSILLTYDITKKAICIKNPEKYCHLPFWLGLVPIAVFRPFPYGVHHTTGKGQKTAIGTKPSQKGIYSECMLFLDYGSTFSKSRARIR